jgi:hypothetical protein
MQLFIRYVYVISPSKILYQITVNHYAIIQVPEAHFEHIKAHLKTLNLLSVADNWGVWMYALYLFLLTIWWSMHWDEASACPYTHLEDVIAGKNSPIIALLIICAELAGGLAVFRYIRILWALQLVPTHKNRAYGDCTTDLQARATSTMQRNLICMERMLSSSYVNF